jgi:HEAT repeat protein
MINASGGTRRGAKTGDKWRKIEENILLERDFAEKLDEAKIPALIAFSLGLNLLAQSEGTLRLIHLRLRDHLVRRYCMGSRLHDPSLYTSSYEPNPAKALANLPDGEAVGRLSQMLQTEGSALLREFAIYGLTKTKHESAVQPLLTALKDDADIRVRKSASRALGQIGGEQAVVGLLAALKDDADEDLRRIAAEALGEISGEQAVTGLLAVLKDDADEGVRRNAAEALGQIGDARAVAGLLAALKDDADSWVRLAVTDALGKIGDARAVAGLLAALKGNMEGSVRRAAARALGQIGGEQAVAGLIAVLEDTGIKRYDRERVAQALVEIGTPEALEAVRQWRARGG